MKIAFLATGTEIIHGDIHNTNSPYMAKHLNELGYQLGLHLAVEDNQEAIEDCLDFLSQSHEVIIIIGGLGPTTDDRTRFALAHFLNKPLIFDEDSWAHIEKRLNHYTIKITENNRQQALFPEGVTVFTNHQGTANGASIKAKDKIFYLLPGPPNECLPLFEQSLLPHLAMHHQPSPCFRKKWRLFGVSESQVAEQLENLIQGSGFETGYRIDYPYLEFKIYSPQSLVNLEVLPELEHFLAPYFLVDPYIQASQLLAEKLITLSEPLLIIDEATDDELFQRIRTPLNRDKIIYSQKPIEENSHQYFAKIHLSGLSEYWHKEEDATETQLIIGYERPGYPTIERTFSFPYRPQRVIKYAAERAAAQLLEWLGALN